MIAGLRGKILSRGADYVVLDVNGVFYQCQISLNTLSELGEVGEETELVVYTHVREDALVLFGFCSEEEKKIFLALISVSGIGPKLGLGILSGLPATDLGIAIVNSDITKLIRIPGVGKKTAERLVLELKDKFKKLLALTPEEGRTIGGLIAHDELSSALVNLGYKARQVDRVLGKLAKKYPPDERLETLIRAALGEMQK